MPPFGGLRTGEVRYASGALPTDYTYTGQYNNTADFGLMYYRARWYDPSLGRFAQADTIVPGAMAIDFDRYAYVRNSPTGAIDPSGHLSCDSKYVADGDCSDMSTEDILAQYYGVTFTSSVSDELASKFFTPQRIGAIYRAVLAVGSAFAMTMKSSSVVGMIINKGLTAGEAFRRVYGYVEMNWCDNCVDGFGWASADHQIRWDGMYQSVDKAIGNVIHELGHLFDRAVCRSNSPTGSCYSTEGNDLIWGGGTARDDLNTFWSRCATNQAACITRPGHAVREGGPYYGFAGGFGSWQFGATHGSGEVFADMFLGWVYNSWENSNAGNYRRDYMNNQMAYYLTTSFTRP